jgi:hypothetical protein
MSQDWQGFGSSGIQMAIVSNVVVNVLECGGERENMPKAAIVAHLPLLLASLPIG